MTVIILVVQEEFDELRHVPREKHFDSKNQIGSNPKFKEFNRYRDIIPYDKTRVELNHCDYVNASWVGPGRTYIATQGLYSYSNISRLYIETIRQDFIVENTSTSLTDDFRPERLYSSTLLGNYNPT